MRRSFAAGLAVAALVAGCADEPAAEPEDLAVADAAQRDVSTVPTTTLGFVEQAGDVLNPERGWFGYVDIGGSFAQVRAPADPVATPPGTIAVVKMDLDQTQAQIPQATLDALTATAAAARTAGVKLVLRPVYRYDDSAASGQDPTDAAFIVSHVHQLGPTLRAQSDVIFAVQLGLLGPWGEFHSSPLIDGGGWTGILDALLDEVPATRMVQVRRPSYKDHFFGGRGPLTDGEAFDGSKVARVGHFNDCFLADTLADQGTYESPTGVVPVRTVDDWRAWAADDTRFTFVGGETCGNNARAECSTALAELAQFHWSFLGSGWYQPTVGPTGVLASCRPEITERLGYRLVLEEVTLSQAVRPGDSLVLSVRLRNEGFAPPVNPRPLYAVLSDGKSTWVAELNDVDPRRWAPGSVSTFARTLGIPGDAADGTYSLSLWLPDAAPSLRARAEYAVRFANEGAWDAATGYNTLTRALAITSTASANSVAPDVSFTR